MYFYNFNPSKGIEPFQEWNSTLLVYWLGSYEFKTSTPSLMGLLVWLNVMNCQIYEQQPQSHKQL